MDSNSPKLNNTLPSKPPSTTSEDLPQTSEQKSHILPGKIKAEERPPLPDEEAPPLPDDEVPPPLPEEAPPNDGWEPVWDENAQAFYFYNQFTKKTQWENPRIFEAAIASPPSLSSLAPGLGSHDRIGGSSTSESRRAAGGYNPAIHGDYDPNADYALVEDDSEEERTATAASAAQAEGVYAATGTFNRFTGKWQNANLNPENFNDENKSKRQMSAFFDVDSAANAHDGRSLRAERQNKKFSRKEIKAFKDKRREKKEEKRRAWLRD